MEKLLIILIVLKVVEIFIATVVNFLNFKILKKNEKGLWEANELKNKELDNIADFTEATYGYKKQIESFVIEIQHMRKEIAELKQKAGD